VFLENRFVAEVRDGVEIKVDDRTGTERQAHDLADEGILQAEKMIGVEGIRVGGEGGTFRQDVETGEEARPRIETCPSTWAWRSVPRSFKARMEKR